MKTTLITPLYTDSSPERNKELQKCFEKNLENTEIDEIILVIDDKTIVRNSKRVKVVYVESRPTYSDLFKIANIHSKGGLSIIANTDIYFDEINMIKLKHTMTEDMCFALSRWDEQADGEYIHHRSRDSQDTWVFKGKINTDDIYGDFFLGMPGCDNRIAYEIGKAGYEIRNPSDTIKSYHVHLTQVKNYERTEKFIVPNPYRLLPPTTIDKMSDVHFLITNTGIAKVGKDINDPTPKEPEFKGLDQYTLEAQKAQINYLYESMMMSKRFTLSLIILTTKNRRYEYKRLFDEFRRQIKENKLEKRVQIYPVEDGGIIPIGWKRNYGNINCSGKYTLHFDDDDWPSPDFLKTLIDTYDANPGVDCITFDAEYTHDGENPQRMIYDVCYKENNSVVLPSQAVYTRMPSHINMMKREIQLNHPFKVLGQVGLPRHTRVEGRSDSGSDVEQSREIVESGAIKKAVHIPKIMYYYRYKENKTY